MHLRGNPLDYNAINVSTLAPVLSPFTGTGRSLLNSNITSAGAVAAGLRKPYSAFNSSVAQSLRPFPQYTSIDTEARGGHSTYHSMTLKLEKRYSAGLTFQGSYVLSKVMTDLGGGLINHFDRSLEKALANYDRTHNVKISYVYELPFGQGRKWLNAGLVSQILGGWRFSGIHMYTSGTPMSLGNGIGFPTGTGGNRPTITTYEGWRAPVIGDQFDPYVDKFLQPVSFFGAQPQDRKGNMTRTNPKLRSFPDYNENISLAKTFPIRESLRLDFRWEAFNQFNRVRFGALSGGTSLDSNNFGLWRTQGNDPRRMQLALKLYW